MRAAEESSVKHWKVSTSVDQTASDPTKAKKTFLCKANRSRSITKNLSPLNHQLDLQTSSLRGRLISSAGTQYAIAESWYYLQVLKCRHFSILTGRCEARLICTSPCNKRTIFISELVRNIFYVTRKII